ncbi:hypothetical protein R69927_00528 [Paraburkholderia domus]|jgi:hypothetical protein|uniref:Uncharacterized protein n=1 Tax=Paraburkholderia domus TaxID=2793075 RepID=A0A9N8MKY5_9BURK|nr:hypothetical protein [Paraburkholderia domus]MBK5047979.1 hypothetical protein [Burkholderia sp. R-70006]MBK5063209.1 hypothetical protein [Burkholderia sp. R-70199]MBK5084518.1 hypothetical protein [Burkholderia sp. R-69927]MBK5123070.1 hypothetical protein [Burkholderia sp. R-69980]MBK5163559.1 hypothetical protein [Burkholderia sp. R-70211]MBK5180278.1 hypothetical protein [Burkholderia sp. R-69749]MCI0148135.1 hypothetical protein [Paraburkholderia sediminicola]
MIVLLSRLSWLFFSVGVPVFAPIALLPLLSFSRFYRHASKGIATKAIRDGQLLWVVISMCASACYEIGCALSEASTNSMLAFMLAGLLWHVLLIVAASILVSFAAADAASRQVYDASEITRDRGLIWLSLLMTAIVSTSFSISHYSLT